MDYLLLILSIVGIILAFDAVKEEPTIALAHMFISGMLFNLFLISIF